jgi:aspartokinase
MTNTTKEVQRFLDQDISIKRDLKRNLINRRALALYISKGLNLHGTIDAVMSAIRRYECEIEDVDRYAKAGKLIKDSKISTKTGISIIALVKDTSVQEQLPKLFSVIHYARGEVLRIIQAEESIKVIVDGKNVSKVVDIFNKNSVIRLEHNLGEINMKLGSISAKVPGVLAILDTELANNNINIVETISCVPEVLWFIHQKDLLKAHHTFLGLVEG